MPVTPSASLSLSIDAARALIAATPTFQALVGADDATEALEFIYVGGIPKGTAAPVAMVDVGDDFNFAISAGGAANYFRDGGGIAFYLEADIAEANRDGYTDAAYDFYNTVGGIVNDFDALAGTAGMLAVRNVSTKAGPFRSDPHTEPNEHYYAVWLELLWGV